MGVSKDEANYCSCAISCGLTLCCVCSEWYLNGNYLVLFVSVGVILPLSLLKNLGRNTSENHHIDLYLLSFPSRFVNFIHLLPPHTDFQVH